MSDQVITNDYAIYNGDNLQVLPTLPDGCIDMSIYSPPFAVKDGALYQYSSAEEDYSNARSYEEFFEHYEFLIHQIYRLTKPGRMSAVHACDVPSGNTGCDSICDYPGDIIRAHTRCVKENCTDTTIRREKGWCGHGRFELAARYFIWKEPLQVRNRLMVKSLAHKTIVDDSTHVSNAGADQLLIFRRKGENKVPVSHPNGLLNYAGSDKIPAELHVYKGWKGSQLENRYSQEIWRRYASCMWYDIRPERVLPYREARDQEDEKHVHALQLDVIERCLDLYSNAGETVLTPFMGVGSEVYGAVRNGRRGVGVELKPSYFRQAVKNISAALTEHREEQGLLDFEIQEAEEMTMGD